MVGQMLGRREMGSVWSSLGMEVRGPGSGRRRFIIQC